VGVTSGVNQKKGGIMDSKKKGIDRRRSKKKKTRRLARSPLVGSDG